MNKTVSNPSIDILRIEKQEGFNYQQRRHLQWTENYELYRDTVIVNRLTQRQSVNIPLIKETIRTLLSKFKSGLDLVFEELSGDKQKELFKNELWQYTVKDAKLKSKDTANKKQVMLYGRTFWKLYIQDGKFGAEVLDPQDILIDRYADPSDVMGTANYVIHQHIFKPLADLALNPFYNTDAVTRLKTAYATAQGLIKANENVQSLQERNQKMADLGVPDLQNPILGQTVVELNEHYRRVWDEAEQEWDIIVTTVCDTEILGSRDLEDILNIDFYPFVTWGDDVERTDIWSDGIADIIRTINKVLNAWFSQLVENRTLRNFGMNFYDATKEGFVPQSFDPIPGGWYPLPGKPSDVYQKVDVPSLQESLPEMEFLIGLAEKATAATATEKGATEQNSITLGEVKLALAAADDRIGDLQDTYQDSWIEFGEKWAKILNANADKLDAVKLYKKSYKGNYFAKTLKPNDWKSDEGYVCFAKSSAEQEKDQMNTVQKLLAVRAQFPGNVPLDKIVKEKLLDLGKLNPEQQREVMDFEAKKIALAAAGPANPMGPGGAGIPGASGPAGPPGAPLPPGPQPVMPPNVTQPTP